MLNVQLHQFHNLYNTEIRPDDTFCCCDFTTFRTCADAPDEIMDECFQLCDTSFLVRMQQCQNSDPCPVVMFTDNFVNSDTITNTSYQFRFVLSSFPSDEVRFKVMFHYILVHVNVHALCCELHLHKINPL